MSALHPLLVLVKIFSRPRNLILGAVIGTALFFAVYEFMMPSFYVARAKIMIAADIKGKPTPKQEQAFSDKAVKTAAEMLKNRNIIEEVVKELKLEGAFGKSDAVEQVFSMVTVKPLEETNILEVSVKAKNAELATLIANTLCNLTAARSVKETFTLEKNLMAWLDEQSSGIRKELEDSRNRLLEFKKACSDADPEKTYIDAKSKIAEFQQSLALVKKEEGQVEPTYEEIQALLKEGKGMEELPEVQTDAGLKSLKAEYAKNKSVIDELLRKYQPNHPVVVELSEKNVKIEASLASRPKEIADAVVSNYLSLKEKEKDLNSVIEKEKEALLGLEAKANEYKKLQDDLKAKETMFGSFLDRIKNEYTTNLNILQLSLAEQAYIPHGKEKPFRLTAIVIGFVIGLFIGGVYNVLTDTAGLFVQKTKIKTAPFQRVKAPQETKPSQETKASAPKGMYIERVKEEGEENK